MTLVLLTVAGDKLKIDTPPLLSRAVIRWHSELGWISHLLLQMVSVSDFMRLDLQHCVVNVSGAITASRTPHSSLGRALRTREMILESEAWSCLPTFPAGACTIARAISLTRTMSLVGLGCQAPVRTPQAREMTLESEAGS